MTNKPVSLGISLKDAGLEGNTVIHDKDPLTSDSGEDHGALWYRCRDFVTEQSCGEWDAKTIAEDTDKLCKFVMQEMGKAKR